jgi:NAD-dependent SIR2 family protein deacetylase
MINDIKKAADLIREADGLLITAGAGMSIDSGLPDFRGGAGMWTAYPALKHLNLNFHEMANPRRFAENPQLGWGWYGHRLIDYRTKTPHDGFRMLMEMAKPKKNGYFVFTSNVDGHFQKAGFEDDLTYECHGSIHDLQCASKCCLDIWSADDFKPEVDMETCLLQNDFPLCPKCGRMARPNVLMFDDWDYVQTKNQQCERRSLAWLAKCDNVVAIEIGAGLAIPTVQMHGEAFADSLIRINPKDYRVHKPRNVGIPMTGLAGITAIYNELMETT